MMSPPRRCPIARSSLTVTAILLDHFEISSSSDDDSKSYLALDSRTNFDKIFRPLILQWSRLHTGGLYAFLRLWKATGAEMRVDLDDEGNQVIDDAEFEKVGDLVRILIEQVIGQASRTKDLSVVEEELSNFGCKRLRELQMEVLELGYEEGWGVHLRSDSNHLVNPIRPPCHTTDRALVDDTDKSEQNSRMKPSNLSASSAFDVSFAAHGSRIWPRPTLHLRMGPSRRKTCARPQHRYCPAKPPSCHTDT